MTPAPFAHTITDEVELRKLYRQPSALVRSKVRSAVDPQSADFLSRSPFVLVGTTGADGSVDVSPRGGPPGFVRLLDDHRLALPDLNGNNLLDSISNIVATGRVGMLFVVPGLSET